MQNTIFNRIKGANFLMIAKDYLHICTYEFVAKNGKRAVKTNDCAAALLSLYENLEMYKRAEMDCESKEPIKHKIGGAFLSEKLLGHYSLKTIKEANMFLEKMGYVTIIREKISHNQHDANRLILNIDRINFALDELSKIVVGKFYPTVILPYPSEKLPNPPSCKITPPSTNFTRILDNNNIDNKENTTNISSEQVAPLHCLPFSNSNPPANNEIENKETELEIPKISFPLNEKMQSSINVTEAGGSGCTSEAKETFFDGKVNAHLQRRMTKLITTKHHKNLLAPIYEKAHRENGFKPLSNEQQNNVFAKFLAKSFVELKDKNDNYLLPTLRENKPFLCKLIELFESVEWQKKTWKAIELQAKSLVHFDSSPEFCTTLIDRTLKGSAQTASVYLQFYYDFDRTKVQFEAFIKTKQAQGDGQNGNVLGNSFTRNGKTIVFAETYTKERSNERFGMYEGVEYCLTHNGAWLVPMKDDATLQNDVQEWNKTGKLRALISTKGV